MATTISIPKPLAQFFSLFPLRTYPQEELWPPVAGVTKPTLWILPGQEDTVLSREVECLKWQAYLAFRALPKGIEIGLRTDIGSEGALGGLMPNLHVPLDDHDHLQDSNGGREGKLLDRTAIAQWVDEQLGTTDDDGGDVSTAWVSLLEGIVHDSFMDSQTVASMAVTIRSYIPLPYSFKLFIPGMELPNIPPPTRPRIAEYAEAIGSLSEKLGTNKWFLGTDNPTPVDALLFAYLHLIMCLPVVNPKRMDIRAEVTRRVNLVAWERRVRGTVHGSWVSQIPQSSA